MWHQVRVVHYQLVPEYYTFRSVVIFHDDVRLLSYSQLKVLAAILVGWPSSHSPSLWNSVGGSTRMFLANVLLIGIVGMKQWLIGIVETKQWLIEIVEMKQWLIGIVEIILKHSVSASNALAISKAAQLSVFP